MLEDRYIERYVDERGWWRNYKHAPINLPSYLPLYLSKYTSIVYLEEKFSENITKIYHGLSKSQSPIPLVSRGKKRHIKREFHAGRYFESTMALPNIVTSSSNYTS